VSGFVVLMLYLFKNLK